MVMQPAWAGFATSAVATFTDGGITYDDVAIIYANPGDSTQATTEVYTANGNTVPAGYMGGQAVIYNSDGTICRQSTFIYQGARDNALVVNISPGCGPNKAYNSRGVAKGWTGSTYNAHFTFRSPNQNS
jgi:hypothetical protein